MGRYLSIVVLSVAAALSASVIPNFLVWVAALGGEFLPMLAGSRGQLSLVMLLVLCWSLHAPLGEGLMWALVGGLALDLLSILPPGATSAALLVIVYAVNSVSRQLFRARIPLLLVMAAVATCFLFSYTYAALFLLGYNYDLLSVARVNLLPTLLYNVAAALPIYAVVRLAQRRLQNDLPVPLLGNAQLADARNAL